jgi:hypothetical protein
LQVGDLGGEGGLVPVDAILQKIGQTLSAERTAGVFEKLSAHFGI